MIAEALTLAAGPGNSMSIRTPPRFARGSRIGNDGQGRPGTNEPPSARTRSAGRPGAGEIDDPAI